MKPSLLPTLFLLLAAISCSSRPDYDATGIFEATTVTISAETTGKITSFPLEEGDSVMYGATIATVDTTTLLLQRAQIASSMQAVESSMPDIAAQASALRAQIAHQESECHRYERLYQAGAATQKQLSDAEAQLNILRSQLTGLLSSLSGNRSSVSDNAVAIMFQREQIDQMIERSVVKSPLTGTILVKYAQEGEFAVPGKPLALIADLDRIYLRSYFTVSQLAGLQIGREVTVIADYGTEKVSYPGRITWIAQESEFTPKSIQTADSRANLVYAVKIAVKNDGRLKLGQYGEVKL